MNDRTSVRSFLVRSSRGTCSGHAGFTWPRDSIASEQLEEMRPLCGRICDLEQEFCRLRPVIARLHDDRVFEPTLEEGTAYGFAPEP